MEQTENAIAADPAKPETARSVKPGLDVPLSRGLSTKLLLLTIAFVLIAEVLIFLPSIANFRLRWLEEKLMAAGAVSALLVDIEPEEISRVVQDDILLSLGVKAIAVRSEGVSRLITIADMPEEVDEHIDLENSSRWNALTSALGTLIYGGDRVIRVFGSAGHEGRQFELVLKDYRLRDAMLRFSRNIAILGLMISVFSAALVYAAIDRIMIRPIRRMTQSMLSFAQAPDDPARRIRVGVRDDEIGVAERELADMQGKLQQMLGEQKHLADLGLAVSKINHDMRNTLTSAQLISDRLAQVKDPAVQAFAPKLLRALDRAASYSEGVLAYGRTQEAAPLRRKLRLSALVDEVFELLGLSTVEVELVNAVPPDFEIDADAEQFYRVLTNLSRNAVQAMAGERDASVVRRLTIAAERQGSVARVLVTDTGPGLPTKARENLFAAFRGSARSGGTGLGLAIAHELVRAHSGSLDLLESSGGRTVFRVTIPDQPVQLEEARRSLRQPA